MQSCDSCCSWQVPPPPSPRPPLLPRGSSWWHKDQLCPWIQSHPGLQHWGTACRGKRPGMCWSKARAGTPMSPGKWQRGLRPGAVQGELCRQGLGLCQLGTGTRAELSELLPPERAQRTQLCPPGAFLVTLTARAAHSNHAQQTWGRTPRV